MKLLLCYTAILLVLVAVACIRKTMQPMLFIASTDISSPGEIILLQFTDQKEADTNGMNVIFGRESGLITGQDTQGSVAVMVPDVAAGKTKLQVTRGGHILGTSEFTILDNTGKSVAFSMEGKAFSVLFIKGTNHAIEQYLGTEGRMLAFDVLNVKGELLMTGTVPYPGADKRFSITIPNAKGKQTIRFYEPASGESIHSGKFVSTREFISEVSIHNKNA